jgi:hypothetical protein
MTLRGSRSNKIVLNVHVPTEDKNDDMKDDGFYKELERVFDKFLNTI